MWREFTNFVPNRGVPQSEVAEFERCLGINLPPDFKSYLHELNGMPEHLVDDDLFHFEKLENLCFSEQLVAGAEGRGVKFLEIADYLISSNVYALGFRDGSFCGIYDSNSRIFDTFCEFLAAYADPNWRGKH